MCASAQMVEHWRRSLNYGEVRARHNPLYYEVGSLTMEEGDVRGARAGPAQMVKIMRTMRAESLATGTKSSL